MWPCLISNWRPRTLYSVIAIRTDPFLVFMAKHCSTGWIVVCGSDILGSGRISILTWSCCVVKGATSSSLLRFLDAPLFWSCDSCCGSLSARCCMVGRLVTGFGCSVWLDDFPVSVSGRPI